MSCSSSLKMRENFSRSAFVFDEFHVETEDGLVGGGEAGVDVGENVADEWVLLEGGAEALVAVWIFGVEPFEGARHAEPAGHVDAGLAPGEDPWDGAEVIKGVHAGALGWARADLAHLDGIDGGGALKKVMKPSSLRMAS